VYSRIVPRARKRDLSRPYSLSKNIAESKAKFKSIKLTNGGRFKITHEEVRQMEPIDEGKLKEDVRAVIAEILEKEAEEIEDEASLVEDLGMDSMMVLEIVAALEKKYRITIPEEELTKIATLNQAVELAKQYVNTQ
jgi:acyl carrier protein